MSENVAETFRDSDGVTKQEVHSNQQSVWMAHWMNNTSCKSTTKQACGRLSICYESQEEENHNSIEKAGNGSEEPEKILSEAAETTKSLRFVDEKSRSTFPMFNLHKKIDGGDVLAWKIDQPSSSHWESIKPRADHDEKGYQLFSLGGSEKQLKDLPPMLQWVHDAKSPSKENPFKRKGMLEFQDKGIAENSRLAVEKSLKSDFVISGSKVNPYGFSFGKTLTRSLCQKEEIGRSNTIEESEQRVTSTVYHGNSMFLVRDKAVSNQFEKSKNPLMTFNDAQLLPQGPSASISQQPEFVAKQFQKIQEHSGFGFFLSKNNPVDFNGSEKSRGRLSLTSPPSCVNDTDGARTCTAADSIEESSRVRKKFSANTTHHFLFTKTDFNLREGGQLLKESMVCTNLKDRYPSDPFNLDRDNIFPIKSGVKLKLLGSSTGSEGEKDSQEFKTSSVNIRNESSSETNTMDLDTFKKNHVSGVVSSSSNKHVELEKQSPMPQAVLDSAREAGGSSLKRKLPDINQQPNDLVAYASSGDTSTSRTQSLDAEHLLLNSERPTAKPNARLSVLELEHSRWVKRLRTGPTFARGNQGSKMGEDGSHEKVNTIFSKIMKFTMTGPDHIAGRSHGKEEPARLIQRAILPGAKSPSNESARKSREAALSNSWIRRLCHNAAASSSEKSKAAGVSESQRSKGSTEMSEKKFPSLAAMALMGKALRGYSSCPLTRNGSTVVWNS